MNYKNSGFTSIECIVSLSVICISMCIIFTSLSNSYNLTNKNSEKIEMLNIAKAYLNDEKYLIKSGKEKTDDSSYIIKQIENYKVETKLENINTDYQCYKISVKVTSVLNSVELDTYVTKS